MARVQPPWAPPLVELSVGVTGHLLCWEKVEADGSWWAWVSWVHESGGRVQHKVVQVRADSERAEVVISWRGGATTRHPIIRPVSRYESLGR